MSCLSNQSPARQVTQRCMWCVNTIMVENNSQDIWLLSEGCLVSELFVKPVTSKAGNSEVYVLCEHYNGREQLSGHMAALRRVFGK